MQTQTTDNVITLYPPRDTLRETILDTLHAWVRQRPGLDPRNYIRDWDDHAGCAAYRSDSRAITTHLRDARPMLRFNSENCRDMASSSRPAGKRQRQLPCTVPGVLKRASVPRPSARLSKRASTRAWPPRANRPPCAQSCPTSCPGPTTIVP